MDAKGREIFLWIESEGMIAHASTAAPAIVSRSTIVSNPAPHHHGQTSSSALARGFRQLSACDLICGMLAGEVCTSISSKGRP